MPAGKRPAQAAAEPKTSVKGFKPAWIKESVEAHTETETPWGRMRKRDSVVDPEEAKKRTSRHEDDDDDSAGGFAIPQLRKVSTPKAEALENGEPKEKEVTFVKPQLKTVKHKEREPKNVSEDGKKLIIPKLNSVKVEKMKELPPPPKKDTPDYRQALKKAPTKDKLDEEKKKGIPMAPPMPPPAPAMPKLFDTGPNLTESQLKKLSKLKSRPKTRPDWSSVLKGIETGPKLKHVDTNDRSKPLLQAVKTKGVFMYESEKDNAHNVLLKEIKDGVKLKGVKTNDRSKPNLDGLRKIRRQMTIEEQIQKSVSMASVPNASSANLPLALASLASFSNLAPEEIMTMNMNLSPEDIDETDDIDKLRDDLQSTKQLLTVEIKSREQQVRENKRLMTKIQNLEKELEIERGMAESEKEAERKREPDEKLMITLKAEAAEARKYSENLEKKFTQTCKEMDKVRLEMEDMERRNSELEKKLQEFLCKRVSISDRRESQAFPDDDMDNGGSDLDSSSDEEESEEKKAKREAREVKMLGNKLKGFKNKEDNAKKERIALKEIMKKHQEAIKEEKKKFKQLQKEVDKMAALMKESDSEDEDEEPEDEEDEDSETESSESESESSVTDSESERSQSEPEDAPADKKKENLVARMRRHENRLAALKKTNFMLKTNVERLQDDLNEQKAQTQNLKADLDSVLAELG